MLLKVAKKVLKIFWEEFLSNTNETTFFSELFPKLAIVQHNVAHYSKMENSHITFSG